MRADDACVEQVVRGAADCPFVAGLTGNEPCFDGCGFGIGLFAEPDAGRCNDSGAEDNHYYELFHFYLLNNIRG